MANGKNFNLYLMDGDVTGRIKCTLSNWTGLAYKIPRLYLDKCKDRQDLKQSGIYFLFAKNDNDEDQVYIGQAGIRKNGEGVLFRVSEHLKDDFYFSDAVMLTTQNNSFGPTEICYLENRFTNMTRETDRFQVVNSNDPNPGNVTEEKESELEDFIDYSKMVLGVLGYKIFVPLIKMENEDKDELVLYISRKTNKQIDAKCLRTNEGFVVLKGSLIHERDTKFVSKSIRDLKEKMLKNNEIKDGRITKNCLFKSPSAAASFVLGSGVNGKVEWKTEKGVTLKELEEE